MTDKEIIRAEIFRRYAHHGTFEGVIAETREDECSSILDFIDSMQENPCDGCTNRKGCVTCENGELRETMQEEPVSDVKTRVKEIFDSCEKIDISDFEKNRVAFGLLELEGFAKIFYEMGKQQEEPVSEELEEAASMYAKEECSRKSPATLPDRCRGCYAPIMYAFKAGAQWQKQQMIKDAVDGVYGAFYNHIFVDYDWRKKKLLDGQKVKLIIIKED